MKEVSLRHVKIKDAFRLPQLSVNAHEAIFHQWRQLEKTLGIDNFRIPAGKKLGFREGWVFADSDAYKWKNGRC
jgi:hypothetical protein